MAIAKSKLTAQSQISVPVEVRKTLGVGPGCILEWEEQGDQVVVRKAGRHTSEEVHQALFGHRQSTTAPAEVKDGIRMYVRKRHARD